MVRRADIEGPWVMCVTDDSRDVHMVWDAERNDHNLDDGLHCACKPYIAELDHPERDPRGVLYNYVIKHRPWVERAHVPDGMPEDIA